MGRGGKDIKTLQTALDRRIARTRRGSPDAASIAEQLRQRLTMCSQHRMQLNEEPFELAWQ